MGAGTSPRLALVLTGVCCAPVLGAIRCRRRAIATREKQPTATDCYPTASVPSPAPWIPETGAAATDAAALRRTFRMVDLLLFTFEGKKALLAPNG
jgi:hypothetical protein